ncbi:MAG: hypothetical protein OYG32_16840 [Rhodospirillaceae bacterium]|nr:hypothetical protein [Rhodospirillaceae bacterium]
MEELIATIKARLAADAYPNEAAVSLGIVMPILRALGWDDADPSQIVPEYGSERRRVDYALWGTGRRPFIFIEVKAVGRGGDGDRQLFEYAFHQGIPLCLLTDGREWHFYLPSGQGSYEERRFYRLNLAERNAIDSWKILVRYLERSRVVSGNALDAATQDYRDLSAQWEAARSIPDAWEKLVSEPEELLVELLRDQTETISGSIPKSDDVLNFLRCLQPREAGNQKSIRAPVESAAPKQATVKGATDVADKTIDSQSGRIVEYRLFGETFQAKNAASALIEILEKVSKRYPPKLEALALAARGRTRNHIARSIEEIYPGRPDLARCAEFAPGWFIGLNISNRDKLRILRKACEVTDMRFGRDLIIELPNAK